MRQPNLTIRSYIVPRQIGSLPPGIIVTALGQPTGLLEPTGQSLYRKDFPELFAAIGNTWCPPRIPRWSWLPRWLAKRITKPNPAYHPDKFVLPDLRPVFYRGRSL